MRDTWEYDGVTWTEVFPSTSPPARAVHAMAYDSARGVVVLFGGVGLADTWEYDGTTWTHVATADSPSGGAMAYDSARRIAVLFGGDSETWEYDGTTWRQVATATSPSSGVIAYDSARRIVVLFGDGTWEFDGVTWTEVERTEPPSGASFALDADSAHCAIAYDSARDVAVLFHGGGASGVAVGSTWQYDGTSWAEVATPTSPAARLGPAMAYDASRGVLVLFGGKNAATDDLADTWEFDGTTWSDVSPSTSPPARAHHAMVFDEARRVTVLFGGGGSYSPGSPYFHCVSAMADTWEYDGTTSTEASPMTSPSDRGAFGLAYDSARGVVVLFGGVHCEGSTSIRVPRLVGTGTWEYDGTSWTEFRTAVTPPAQLGHAMAYDSARGAVLLFGSYGPDGSTSPTWEYYGP